MRIIIVNSFFPPWRGGAETYVSNLSKHLRRRGHEVTVLCSSPPLNPGVHYVNGVTVKRLRLLTRICGTLVMPDLPPDLGPREARYDSREFSEPIHSFLRFFGVKAQNNPVCSDTV